MTFRIPELFHLSRVNWQFFVSLTFKDAALRNRPGGRANIVRVRMFHAWGREISSRLNYTADAWKRCKWALRLEQGELGHHWHFHALLNGFPHRAENYATCKMMEAQWRAIGGGWPKCKLYDSSLSGADYVLKCLSGAKEYEFQKFGTAVELTLSPGLMAELGPMAEARLRRRQTGESRRATEAKPSAKFVGVSSMFHGPVEFGQKTPSRENLYRWLPEDFRRLLTGVDQPAAGSAAVARN